MPLVTDDPSEDTGFGKVTYSRYQATVFDPVGLFDPAYVRDDGSVERFPRNVRRTATVPVNVFVSRPDPRLSLVPAGQNGGGSIVVPKGR